MQQSLGCTRASACTAEHDRGMSWCKQELGAASLGVLNQCLRSTLKEIIACLHVIANLCVLVVLLFGELCSSGEAAQRMSPQCTDIPEGKFGGAKSPRPRAGPLYIHIRTTYTYTYMYIHTTYVYIYIYIYIDLCIHILHIHTHLSLSLSLYRPASLRPRPPREPGLWLFVL